MILLAGNHHIKVEALVERFPFIQSRAQSPGPQGCGPPGACVRRELDRVGFVVGRERFCALLDRSSKTHNCRQNPDLCQLLYRSQHHQRLCHDQCSFRPPTAAFHPNQRLSPIGCCPVLERFWFGCWCLVLGVGFWCWFLLLASKLGASSFVLSVV